MPRPASAKASSGIAVPTAKPRVRPIVRQPDVTGRARHGDGGEDRARRTARRPRRGRSRGRSRCRRCRRRAAGSGRTAARAGARAAARAARARPATSRARPTQRMASSGRCRLARMRRAEQGEDREAQRQPEDDRGRAAAARTRRLPRRRARPVRRLPPPRKTTGSTGRTHGDRPVMIPPTRPISTSVTPQPPADGQARVAQGDTSSNRTAALSCSGSATRGLSSSPAMGYVRRS